MPARHPIVVVHDLVTDGGRIAMTGVDHRIGGEMGRPEMDRKIVGKSENDRPVAPGPPWNRVSPENTARSSGAYQHTEPGE
ncbi:hypothetical protein AOT92_11915 [Mycobacteroides sp. H101]|nr:hypothetical protein AOT92_11915 [Mycobacteroides sp. H101]